MRCLEGNHVQSVLLKKVVIEPNVKLECVPKFCYLGDTFGAGGVEETARTRVRCARAKFKSRVVDVARRGRLRWFGHLQHIKECGCLGVGRGVM